MRCNVISCASLVITVTNEASLRNFVLHQVSGWTIEQFNAPSIDASRVPGMFMVRLAWFMGEEVLLFVYFVTVDVLDAELNRW